MTLFGLAQPVRRVEDPRLLKGDGVAHVDMPATPEKIWRALAAV